jgi:hypothetical protein
MIELGIGKREQDIEKKAPSQWSITTTNPVYGTVVQEQRLHFCPEPHTVEKGQLLRFWQEPSVFE